MAALTSHERNRIQQTFSFFDKTNITPDSAAIDILSPFQAYLDNCATKVKGGVEEPLSASSVATYGSCARSYFTKYANGREYKLKHVLEKSFIEKSMECDRKHGAFKRSSQMIRCGLKHLKKFYERVCKQKGFTDIYEKKDIEVSYKPVTINFKHVSKISSYTKDEIIDEFVRMNPPPTQRKRKRIAFESEEELKEYLDKFTEFESAKKQQQIFTQHGFKASACANSTFSSD